MTQGAFAAVLKGDQILLVKPHERESNYSGHWNFPGGVVEAGELPEAGAEREVLEETGVVCTIGELLDSSDSEVYDIAIKIFKASYISGDLKIQEAELSEAAWFPIKETLALPLAFDIKQVIEKLIALIENN